MQASIKNYMGLAIVLAVLAVGYSALSYTNSYSKSIEPSSFRSFSVSGEGKVITVPDIAQFSFNVTTEGGNDLAGLQAENTKKINSAIELLKTQRVDKKDIKTKSYNISPRYKTYNCYSKILPLEAGEQVKECPPPEIVGYTISQSVQVKIRNFDTIGAILSGIVDAGINNASQLSFTIDDPTALKDQAREEAIKQAKEKAKSIAKAGGFSVGRLLGIDEGYSPAPYYRYGIGGDVAVESLAISATPSIEPGSEEVVINVTLRYEIR